MPLCYDFSETFLKSSTQNTITNKNRYFENKPDASYIVQRGKLKIRKNKFEWSVDVAWRVGHEHSDAYSAIYRTDATLKGKSRMLKLSNLHWKCTMRHVHSLFNDLAENGDTEADDDTKMDFNPRWIRICEDKNG